MSSSIGDCSSSIGELSLLVRNMGELVSRLPIGSHEQHQARELFDKAAVTLGNKLDQECKKPLAAEAAPSRKASKSRKKSQPKLEDPPF